jgi:hypothetical protein
VKLASVLVSPLRAPTSRALEAIETRRWILTIESRNAGITRETAAFQCVVVRRRWAAEGRQVGVVSSVVRGREQRGMGSWAVADGCYESVLGS